MSGFGTESIIGNLEIQYIVITKDTKVFAKNAECWYSIIFTLRS